MRSPGTTVPTTIRPSGCRATSIVGVRGGADARGRHARLPEGPIERAVAEEPDHGVRGDVADRAGDDDAIVTLRHDVRDQESAGRAAWKLGTRRPSEL